jgi:hypothetical protein
MGLLYPAQQGLLLGVAPVSPFSSNRKVLCLKPSSKEGSGVSRGLDMLDGGGAAVVCSIRSERSACIIDGHEVCLESIPLLL